MQIGIVGLPFSGKSTLFQAITGTHIDPQALARGDVHHGVVKVPDARLERLAETYAPKKTTHATIEFVDVVGLKKGESGSTQFTTNFFNNVKNNDALVQVVRAFVNDVVPHPDGTIDVMRDVVTFETEFILADLAILETRIDRIKKQVGKAGDAQAKLELPVLEKCHRLLEQEKPLRDVEFSKEETTILKTYQLLSLKPMLIALNCDESQVKDASRLVEQVAARKNGLWTRVVAFFGKIDMEMSELPADEARAFMSEYGITEPAVNTLIREAYALLGLQSFLTAGADECRAWTIRKGMTAQESAGVIHSDFFGKFIRAEVVHFNDFIAHGTSFARAKEAGCWRLEGKEYIVEDGDIMEIRHS
jgi:GTP-binding protein YchF